MNNSSKMVGVIFVILGMLCMIFPVISSLWIEMIVGACLIAGAIFSLFRISKGRGFWGKVYQIALFVLYGIAGVWMIINPVQGVSALIIGLGFIFIFEGIFALIYWSSQKSSGLMLLNGIVTLILGVLLLFNPDSGIWFVGIIAGIDLIFTGLGMVAEFPDLDKTNVAKSN